MSTQNEDREFQSLMEMAPATQELSPELKGRLRTMAASTNVGRRFVWRSRWTVRLATAGLALVAFGVFAFTMTPTLKASALERVVKAVDELNSFQFSVVSSGDGQNHRFTMACADGKFGMKADDGMIVMFDSGKMSFYSPEKNEVMELNLGGLVDPKEIAKDMKEGMQEGMKDMDLKKILHDFEKDYGKDNVHVGPITQKWGKSMYEVVLQKPNDPERVTLSVNADTDLPERIQIEGRKDGSDALHQTVIEMQIGGAVALDLSKSPFPANAKHIELDLSKMIGDGLKGLDGKKFEFDGKKFEEGMKESFGLGKLEGSLKGKFDGSKFKDGFMGNHDEPTEIKR